LITHDSIYTLGIKNINYYIKYVKNSSTTFTLYIKKILKKISGHKLTNKKKKS